MTTMTASRIDRFAHEVLQHAPDLAKHAELIKGIAQHVADQGVCVGTRYDIGASSIARSDDGSGGVIHVNPKSGADCLWDFAHEAGHLSEPPKKCDPIKQLEREKAAWEAGWKLMVKLDPNIVSEQHKYDRRRDKCLETYDDAAERYRNRCM